MLTNRSMPPGAVVPELPYPDVRAAAAWLGAAFGWTVRVAIGDHRVQLSVGDGAVVLTAAEPGGPARAAVLVRVPDVDAHHARAVRHGAHILRPPADHPYGERQYTAEDLAGHRWTFSQTLADVPPEDWGGVRG
jgi:uncharacterized glyoxalase superfamily protein PhnB